MNSSLIMGIVFAVIILYHGFVYTAVLVQCGECGGKREKGGKV